jgi:hypothetical protein
MPALLALIPFRDWIYGALIVGLIVFGIHERNHLIAEGAAHEVAALKESSDKLIAKETAHVALVAKTYAAAAAQTQGDLDAKIQAADAQHTSDAQRLREYSAYRSTHPDVASPAGASGNSGAGTSSAGQSEDFVASLGQSGVALADALRDTSAALSACMKDRNDLTGKP